MILPLRQWRLLKGAIVFFSDNAKEWFPLSYRIIEKRDLNPQVYFMKIEAPLIARRAEPGQFVVVRLDEFGERVPFTIADFDREAGTITLFIQAVGHTTKAIAQLSAGDCLADVAGPLGMPTELEGYKKVAVIGGGLGTAIAWPQAKKLHALGTEVTVITGFRDTSFIILADELREASDRLIITTDDGSNGLKGFVTDRLQELLEAGERFDLVIAIGPLVMMRAVCNLTKQYGIPTTVSMNPIMIDGTGMCGGCRVIVGGQTKFACVDGPDFDGHAIDWNSAIRRGRMYRPQEQRACEYCRMTGKEHSHD